MGVGPLATRGHVDAPLRDPKPASDRIATDQEGTIEMPDEQGEMDDETAARRILQARHQRLLQTAHADLRAADDALALTRDDWDRALWGDPEIEFAFLDYCGISEPPFWEGYGAVRNRSPEAEIRRLFYLLYEVQKYIVIRRVRGNDPVRADAYRRQCLRLADQLAGIGDLP